VITVDLRHAIAAGAAALGLAPARGPGAPDPGLRPGERPGQYSSTIAFALARAGRECGERGGSGAPPRIAALLAGYLNERHRDWIAGARASGPGYLTVTVTPGAMTGLAARIAAAGPDCVRGDALAGQRLPAPGAGPWQDAATWDQARERLARQLASRLAAAAGASGGAAGPGGTAGGTGTGAGDRSGKEVPEVAAAIAHAGTDAVLFSLASAAPGRPVRIDPGKIARHHQDNPAYAVRYAHARAASGVRWAAALGTGEAGPQRLPAEPEELALLDALSWLPERAASAARRGRPDEFARFTRRVAGLTLAAVTIPVAGRAPGSDRLAIARAARAGLAASLGLLGISAPDRL
jgi:arginyl-tRNA synthetase